ncbi:MATE efflux family protein [Labilithrix luteola]|uniref:Multidrug-efflux transporter n=1 Tax=Labilithrix luteola TaxID=1391654 RepID=A0A0K1Q6B9_9BACT|nr:MATE family efflux transporter [Labilithrix luteola]AKV01259.1 MATE efflux family protein [Labilithrix luteola]
MADGALAREVRRLALPAILHSLLQTLVFVVDRIMLGQHGETSLAAMQLGGAIEWSIWSVFASFEVGTIARVGRHVGAKNPAAARRAAWISLAMAFGLGSLLAIVSPLVLRALPLVAANVSPAALDEARGYLAITMAASPLVFLSMISIATLQAGGDTKTPLVIGIFANVIHVALNRALILGVGSIPALGARGAAISTAITFGLEAACAALALTSRRRPVSLRKPLEPPPEEPAGPSPHATREEARQLAHVAFPALLERVLYHIGYVGYVLMIARLGDAAMAANQSLISVESICFLSGDGFGIAAAALVAQKLGASKPGEARKAAKIATRDAILALTIFGLVALAFRDAILPLFAKDPEVIAIGRSAMPVLAVAQPFMATAIVIAQSLRGAGQTRQVLGVSVVGALFVRLSMTWLFAIALGFGLVGVWLGSTLDWAVRTALLLVIAVRSREGRDSGAATPVESATVNR